MENEIVKDIRKGLAIELENYSSEKLAKFKPIYYEYVDKVLFDYDTDKDGNIRKYFALPIDLMKRINFEDIDFDHFDAREFNFTGFHGVMLDPQNIYRKDLTNTKLSSVTINGSLKEVTQDGTIYNGCIILLQKIKKKSNIRLTL